MYAVATSYTEWHIALKLSAIDKGNSMYKIYISEFSYRWPKVSSLLRPIYYKSMGEIQNHLFWTKVILNTIKHCTWLWHTEHENSTRDPCLCPWGHLSSRMVSSSFSRIIFERGMLERWKCLSCVWLNDADRLISNMTISGQIMTLTWGRIFKLTFKVKL